VWFRVVIAKSREAGPVYSLANIQCGFRGMRSISLEINQRSERLSSNDTSASNPHLDIA